MLLVYKYWSNGGRHSSDDDWLEFDGQVKTYLHMYNHREWPNPELQELIDISYTRCMAWLRIHSDADGMCLLDDAKRECLLRVIEYRKSPFEIPNRSTRKWGKNWDWTKLYISILDCMRIHKEKTLKEKKWKKKVRWLEKDAFFDSDIRIRWVRLLWHADSIYHPWRSTFRFLGFSFSISTYRTTPYVLSFNLQFENVTNQRPPHALVYFLLNAAVHDRAMPTPLDFQFHTYYFRSLPISFCLPLRVHIYIFLDFLLLWLVLKTVPCTIRYKSVDQVRPFLLFSFSFFSKSQ